MSTPSRGSSVVRPPEKGVFPLDHDGECKAPMITFLKCLKENDQNHLLCKDLSKAYLECRMAANLMQSEDLTALGFKGDQADYNKLNDTIAERDRKKEKEGFIAGTGIKQRAGGKSIFDKIREM